MTSALWLLLFNSWSFTNMIAALLALIMAEVRDHASISSTLLARSALS